MVSRWSCFGANSRFDASCRCIDEIRWLWLFPHSDVSVARGCSTAFLDILDTDYLLCYLWCSFSLRANRFEVYQCLFFSIALRHGALCIVHDDANSHYGCSVADVITWIDDGAFLRLHRYDLSPCRYA